MSVRTSRSRSRGSATGSTGCWSSRAATDADFKDALFGFASGDLKRMILEDKLGQTATIMFDHIERNVPVTPQETSFTPPKGADVIGKPKK